MGRRRFIKQCGILGAGTISSVGWNSSLASVLNRALGDELKSDIIIIGGGLGACAAALAACRNGSSVIMTEPTDWIGGQVSQQAVPPDEHQWIESHGRTASYARYRSLIREYYKKNYPLSEMARKAEFLNPGNGAVSRLCHEPAISVAVLESMLAPAISKGQLKLLLNTEPYEVHTDGDSIRAVNCHTGKEKRTTVLNGAFFIDASEEGNLLKLSGTEYIIGAESQKQTGERHAPEKEDPTNIQALTHCFAVDHLEGEDHTIEPPVMYPFWKEHVPSMNPAWPGKLISFEYSNPRTLLPKSLSFVPSGKAEKAPQTDPLNLWLYRRIIDRDNFEAGTFLSDISLINWPQNDFLLGNITDVPAHVRKQNLYKAKQLSLSLLYWLQTEAPRPDGFQGWKGLRLRKDLTGTEDGLAKFPYIRESRRIMAETTILEQDISLEDRMRITGKPHAEARAKTYNDAVGIGYYPLDLHPSTGGDNYIDMVSVPFQVPLGSMIPVRMENLIPGCKNIGTTHISNGCYRLHPVEWTIGEAAGSLCAFSLKRKAMPRQVRNSQVLLSEFQDLLKKSGFELTWPKSRHFRQFFRSVIKCHLDQKAPTFLQENVNVHYKSTGWIE
ncbi:MAG: FAD-dependent oxidoreductase [Bacteroidetes bacterium]|nr:FAD-dependent oxidoreductase [Bacteroidota bacterium]